MLRATPLGCHQERRTPLNAPEHASEAATVERDCLQHLTAFANAHAAFIGNVGVPDGMVGIDYGGYGVPETYVIDKLGVIRYKCIGPLTPEIVKEKLLPLVQELSRV